jgi:hypothetical protein
MRAILSLLALPLLVALDLADYPDHAVAADNFALLTARLY